MKIYASDLEETVSNERTAMVVGVGDGSEGERDDTREEMADDKFYGR